MILDSERTIPLVGRRRAPWWIAALFVAATWSSASYAQGVDAETRTVARDLARQGADAFERHDYTTALDRLTRAFSLFRAPTISVMQARSLARLGRLVEALDKYEETHRMLLGDDATDAFRQAVNEAKGEAEELRARIPRVLVRVRATSGRIEGLKVQVDGKPLPAALLDVERPIDPGTHQISVTASNCEPVVRNTTLAEGERAALEIPLDPAPKPASPAAPEPVAPTAETAPPPVIESSNRAPWGWVGVGAGAAGLAVFAVSGAIALDTKKSLDEVCRPGCPSNAADDIDSFRRMRTISYVGLAAGVAGIGIGGYVLLSGSRDSAHVGVSIGPGMASVGGAF
jgi:hypothetical protein